MNLYFETELGKLYNGHVLEILKALPSDMISCCITSPPYWALRDYGTDGVVWDGDADCEHEWGKPNIHKTNLQAGNPEFQRPWRENASGVSQTNFCNKCGAWKGQLGLEPDFNLYIKHLCDIFDEVKRVLRKDGTCWVNLGDTYGGNNSRGSNGGRAGFGNEREGVFVRFESKNLCNIPARFSIEMQNRGWILRNKIIWHKPNCMPSSVTDRFTVDFEEIFFFVKSKKYWFEQQFEDLQCQDKKNPQGRNKRTVWTAETKYEDLSHEKKMRQGMNKERGNNLVEKRDLPQQKEFVDYMRKNYTVEQIVEKTGMQRTKVEHWFRYDESGFSYPSKEDWKTLGDEEFPELIEVWFEADDVKSNVNGRNKRTVWKIPTQPFPDAHFAVFPEKLVETPIKAGCPKEICTKCGKPREKVKVPIGEFEFDEIEYYNNTDKSKPYSVVPREGYVPVRQLPNMDKLKIYLQDARKKAGYTIDEVEDIMDSQAPHHWFNGEAYPTVEDWSRIKELLKFDSTYDKAMTEVKYKPAEKCQTKYKDSLTKCDCNAPFVAGIVLDPFIGSGTTAVYCEKNHYRWIGCEVSDKYCEMIKGRLEPYKMQKRLI